MMYSPKNNLIETPPTQPVDTTWSSGVIKNYKYYASNVPTNWNRSYLKVSGTFPACTVDLVGRIYSILESVSVIQVDTNQEIQASRNLSKLTSFMMLVNSPDKKSSTYMTDDTTFAGIDDVLDVLQPNDSNIFLGVRNENLKTTYGTISMISPPYILSKGFLARRYNIYIPLALLGGFFSKDTQRMYEKTIGMSSIDYMFFPNLLIDVNYKYFQAVGSSITSSLDSNGAIGGDITLVTSANLVQCVYDTPLLKTIPSIVECVVYYPKIQSLTTEVPYNVNGDYKVTYSDLTLITSIIIVPTKDPVTVERHFKPMLGGGLVTAIANNIGINKYTIKVDSDTIANSTYPIDNYQFPNSQQLTYYQAFRHEFKTPISVDPSRYTNILYTIEGTPVTLTEVTSVTFNILIYGYRNILRSPNMAPKY